MYAVKEIFYSLQGEGFHAGRPAVFCRFSGCNLWSGRESDRATAACSFCDTDFVGTDGEGGGRFQTAESLAQAIEDFWPPDQAHHRFVVFTGGEPLLQLDQAAVTAIQYRGFECAVETNGSVANPPIVDWLTVSPKGSVTVRLDRADELKLVFPQPENSPDEFAAFKAIHRYLQPKDDRDRDRWMQAAVQYCLAHPEWRLSLQTHKYLGIR